MPTTRTSPSLKRNVELLPEQEGVYSVEAELMRYRRPMSAEEVWTVLGIGKTKFYELLPTGELPPAMDNLCRTKSWDPAVVLFWYRRRNSIYAVMRRKAA